MILRSSSELAAGVLVPLFEKSEMNLSPFLCKVVEEKTFGQLKFGFKINIYFIRAFAVGHSSPAELRFVSRIHFQWALDSTRAALCDHNLNEHNFWVQSTAYVFQGMLFLD